MKLRMSLVARLRGISAAFRTTKPDWKALSGDWQVTALYMFGVKCPIDDFKGPFIVFSDGKFNFKHEGNSLETGIATIDLTKNPKEMDMHLSSGKLKSDVLKAIYEVRADTLKLAWSQPGKKRPTEFKAPEGGEQTYLEMKKVK